MAGQRDMNTIMDQGRCKSAAMHAQRVYYGDTSSALCDVAHVMLVNHARCRIPWRFNPCVNAMAIQARRDAMVDRARRAQG